MKKIKLVVAFTALIFCVSLITGCGNTNELNKKNQNEEEKSIAKILAKQFLEEVKKDSDIEKIANKIAENEVLQVQMDVVPIKKEDYISGFQIEIKDFNNAVTIRPMIGSIPFLAYIFDVENAEEFAEELKRNADLRWNICTEADEVETAIFDHYVFFVMSPKTFDEE